MQFLSNSFLENSMQTWLLAVLITALLYGLFWLVQKLVLKRVCKLAAQTKNDVDDLFCEILADIRKFFLLGLAVLLASRMLILSVEVKEGIRVGFVILAILQGGFLVNRLVMYLLEKQMNQETGQEQSASLKTIGRFIRGMVWAIVIVMAPGQCAGYRGQHPGDHPGDFRDCCGFCHSERAFRFVFCVVHHF